MCMHASLLYYSIFCMLRNQLNLCRKGCTKSHLLLAGLYDSTGGRGFADCRLSAVHGAVLGRRREGFFSDWCISVE